MVWSRREAGCRNLLGARSSEAEGCSLARVGLEGVGSWKEEGCRALVEGACSFELAGCNWSGEGEGYKEPVGSCSVMGACTCFHTLEVAVAHRGQVGCSSVEPDRSSRRIGACCILQAADCS